MITKERLQELINQGATIYRLNHLANKTVSILLDKKDYIGIGFLNEDVYVRGNPELRFYGAWYKLEDLFETEEDVKWELEMTATRTETLKMPKWEEICDDCLYDITFIDTKKNKWQLNISDGGILFIDFSLCGRGKYWDKPTKENYIEACKLCLKIFKGEKGNE